MCDACDEKLASWRGWTDIPRTSVVGRGPWTDLSHPIQARMPGLGEERAPRIFRRTSMPKSPLNTTQFEMGAHMGTHIDAPIHFIADGPTIDEIPFDRLYGPGVVWRIDAEKLHVVRPAELEKLRPKMQPGDIVIFDSGMWEKPHSSDYNDAHFSLSVDAAQWLVRNGAKMVATDCRSPETPKPARGPGWRWPVHGELLSHGVLVAEHVSNLHALAGHRVEAAFLGLNIKGSDGAPARAVARLAD